MSNNDCLEKINNKITQSYESIDIINYKIKHISNSLKKLIKQINKKNREEIEKVVNVKKDQYHSLNNKKQSIYDKIECLNTKKNKILEKMKVNIAISTDDMCLYKNNSPPKK